MKKVCRVCKEEYDFCPSCLKNRPYLEKFCSLQCREEYIKKQEELISNKQKQQVN